MNRNQGGVSFNKDWQAYKVGFGNLSGDHWLGLEHMHLLTENRRYTLRYVLLKLLTISSLSSNKQ